MSDPRYSTHPEASGSAGRQHPSQQQPGSYHSQRSNTGQSEGNSSSHYSNAVDTAEDLSRATADINLAGSSHPASSAADSQVRFQHPSAAHMAQSHSQDPSAGSQASAPIGSEDYAQQSALRPSTSSSNGVAPDANSSRNRADMDRIKSRAVDPGWSWEREREKYEAGASLRSNSIESRPSLPSRGSSRPAPRLDTSGATRIQEGSDPGSAGRSGSGIASNVASPHNLQAPPNPSPAIRRSAQHHPLPRRMRPPALLPPARQTRPLPVKTSLDRRKRQRHPAPLDAATRRARRAAKS